ncbi:MAG: hypothetical protein JWQ13_4306 [Ramlibacter sp.]|jgi:hypothetical protein|nr:hypothetical protein [Ramlibacter sp.]
MRRYLIPLFVAANIALAGVLAWLWVTPQGQVRNVRWTPPAPLRPVLNDSELPSWSVDLGSFVAALDRPLFAATRRPPPKPEEAPAVVADTLGDVRILGLYSTGGTSGGGIVRAEGKIRRVRQGDVLGGWTIKEVRPHELLLARGNEERTLDVKRGPDLAADVPGAPGAGAAGPAGSTPPGGDPGVRRQQEADASKAAVNAMRARAGMAPLP